MNTRDVTGKYVTGKDATERCPSDFGLERLRSGELGGSQAGRDTAAHVANCVSCTARMATFAAAPPAFPLDAVWRTAHGPAASGLPAREEARARLPDDQRRSRFALPFSLTFTAAAAIVAAAVMILRPAPPRDVNILKGGPWSLTVIAKPRGQSEVARIVSGARLAGGDRLRFEVSTTLAHGHLAIISLDSAGVISPLVPSRADGTTVEVPGGRHVLLDGAVELDLTAGPERIELVGCPRALSMAEVATDAREALARAGGDLRKLGPIAPGCHQETFWIERTGP